MLLKSLRHCVIASAAAIIAVTSLIAPAVAASCPTKTVRLVSLGRTADQSQSAWRLDNLSGSEEQVVLLGVGSGYSETIQVPAGAQVVVLSPIGGTGALTHKLNDATSGCQLDVKAAGNQLYAPPAPPPNGAGSSEAVTQTVIGQLLKQRSVSITDAINLRLHQKVGSVVDNARSRYRFTAQLADANGRAGASRSGEEEQLFDGAGNIWVRGRVSGFEDTGSAAYDGEILDVHGGADLLLGKRFLVGLFVGREEYEIDTDFNAGFQDGQGFAFGPYIGVLMTPELVYDLWVGWTWLDYDNRVAGADGDFDAERWFVSQNLTWTLRFGAVRVAPRLSGFYAEERQDAYVNSLGGTVEEQTIRYGQVGLGAEIGYAVNIPATMIELEPFVFGRMHYEFASDEAVAVGNGEVIERDRFGGSAGAGINGVLAPGTALRFLVEHDVGGGGFDSWTAEAMLQLRF